MKIWRPVIILFFLNPLFVSAQEKYELSDCLVFSLKNSPKLRAEKLAQKKESVELYSKKNIIYPEVDAFLNYHNYFNDLPTYMFPEKEGSVLAGETINGAYPVQLGLPHNLNTGIEINQTVFDMNFFGNGAIDQHYQNYNNIKLSMVEEEILYQVAVLFYQIAVNEEKLKFLNLNLERLDKLHSIVKLQAEQGFARQTDLDKLLVKTSNLKSKKNKLQSGIKQQLGYLKMMMGMQQSNELVILYDESETLNLEMESMGNEGILGEKMLEEQRELNKMNAKRINADYYPKLQAYAAFLFQAQRDRFNFLQSNQDWYNIHQWGLKLSVPIMGGFEKKTKKEISEIVNAQLSFGLEQKKEQSQLEFQNAVAELEVARMEQESQKENVDLADRMYLQSELSYEQGTMMLMDFLDSEATLRESKMMFATALLDTRIAELKILKTSGKLKELVNL